MLHDLGNLEYFLGIESHATPNGLLLTQSKYIHDLPAKANMQSCNGIATPATPGDKLTARNGCSMANPFLYRTIVGGLQYLTFTRPDITYSVNKVSQFMHSPTKEQWTAIKHILRYLKSSASHCLLISKSPSQRIRVQMNANGASNLYD
ncbi:hypothetical protein GH714_016640 [Hevea brasiliensis]|uniref:Reverse transcriptase Ty1/copia-type domain-containing protein n=1 Tax=Hevea brasiliensis TaxID=3981 RepID=A0A6A6LT66_HEVBR|nr:hypothetical protein GH714_016640 [Hevea brasiliensis]